MKPRPASLASDEIAERLSQNIKLRSELGAQIAKVLSDSSNQHHGQVASSCNSLEALRRELRSRRNQ